MQLHFAHRSHIVVPTKYCLRYTFITFILMHISKQKKCQQLNPTFTFRDVKLCTQPILYFTKYLKCVFCKVYHLCCSTSLVYAVHRVTTATYIGDVCSSFALSVKLLCTWTIMWIHRNIHEQKKYLKAAAKKNKICLEIKCYILYKVMFLSDIF